MFFKKKEKNDIRNFYQQETNNKKSSTVTTNDVDDFIKQLKKEKIKAKLGFVGKPSHKLPSFNKFLEIFYDVIISNKENPSFGKKEAIRKTGEKMKNQGLLILAASLDNKEQTIYILSRQKDKQYYQFQEIILEKDLDKTLEFIKILRQYQNYLKNYKKTVSYMNFVIQVYFFGFLFGLFSIIILPYTLIKEGGPSDVVNFYTYRPHQWEFTFVFPLLGLSANNIFLKIQFILELFFLLVVPFFVLLYLVKSFYQFLVEKNKRLIDKLYNEINFSILLMFKIIQLRMGERFQDVNYEKFLVSIGKIGYERGLVNFEWFKNFSKLMQLYAATKNVLEFKYLTSMSELFYNNLRYILETIRVVYLGKTQDFSLQTIYDRFNMLTEIIQEITVEKAQKWNSTQSFIMMAVIMGITMLISFYSLMQSNDLKKVLFPGMNG